MGRQWRQQPERLPAGGDREHLARGLERVTTVRRAVFRGLRAVVLRRHGNPPWEVGGNVTTCEVLSSRSARDHYRSTPCKPKLWLLGTWGVGKDPWGVGVWEGVAPSARVPTRAGCPRV